MNSQSKIIPMDLIFLAVEVLTHQEAEHLSLRNATKILPTKLGIRDSETHGLIHAIVFETIRRRNLLDRIIHKGFSGKFGKKISQKLKNLTRIISYLEIFTEDVVEDTDNSLKAVMTKKYFDYSDIPLFKKFLEFIKTLDADNFIDEIHDPLEKLSAQYFHPTWIIKDLISFYKREKTIKILEANNSISPLFIRLNTLHYDKEEILSKLNSEKVKIEIDKDLEDVIKIISWEKPLPRLESHKNGLYYIQNKGSSLISHIVDPKPGETILDTCAAPGGKSFHMAQLQKDLGNIFAVDNNNRRLRELKRKKKIFGLKSVHPILADFREHLNLNMKVDKILIDAPCSGSGTFSTRPDGKWRISRTQLKFLNRLQYALLENASKYLKDNNSFIVYSTCSIFPIENELIIKKFLEKYENFELKDQKLFIGEQSPMFDKGQRLFPHLNETEGFAIFKLGYV